jgi:hypothetical protein
MRPQCLMCKHARWRGSRPVGCLRFENSVGDADMAIVMQALLWQIAGSQKCVARERLLSVLTPISRLIFQTENKKCDPPRL